jgi:hypothetical protein
LARQIRPPLVELFSTLSIQRLIYIKFPTANPASMRPPLRDRPMRASRTPSCSPTARRARSAFGAAIAFSILFLMAFGEAAHACPRGEERAAVGVEQPFSKDAQVIVMSVPSPASVGNGACCAAGLHCAGTCSSSSCSAALPASTSGFDLDRKASDSDPPMGTTLTPASLDVDCRPPRLSL